MPKPKIYIDRKKVTFRLSAQTYSRLDKFLTKLQGISKANKTEVMELALITWLNNTNNVVQAAKERSKKRV